VIRGTRLTVELILRKLSEGASEVDLMEAYPRLTREDIQAAIRYAADTLVHEETIILGSPKKSSQEIIMRFLADECCDPWTPPSVR